MTRYFYCILQPGQPQMTKRGQVCKLIKIGSVWSQGDRNRAQNWFSLNHPKLKHPHFVALTPARPPTHPSSSHSWPPSHPPACFLWLATCLPASHPSRSSVPTSHPPPPAACLRPKSALSNSTSVLQELVTIVLRLHCDYYCMQSFTTNSYGKAFLIRTNQNMTRNSESNLLYCLELFIRLDNRSEERGIKKENVVLKHDYKVLHLIFVTVLKWRPGDVTEKNWGEI